MSSEHPFYRKFYAKDDNVVYWNVKYDINNISIFVTGREGSQKKDPRTTIINMKVPF